MSDISQYLKDHGNTGHCAFNYYHGTHDVNTCAAAPGVCAVIAYLVAELKNAEFYHSVAPQPQLQPTTQQPQYDPLTDPAFTQVGGSGTGNDRVTYQFQATPPEGTPGSGSAGAGGSGVVPWTADLGYPLRESSYSNGGNGGSSYPTGAGGSGSRHGGG